MANFRQLEIIKQGVDIWNKWKDNAPSTPPYLSGADLSWMRLPGVNFRGGYLNGADLVGSELMGADFKKSDLRGANLSWADLRWADFSGADLRWADLHGAKLNGARLNAANLYFAKLAQSNLQNADLVETDLEGADLEWAILGGANLSDTKLVHATLFRADLDWANLTNANLTDTDLRGATLHEARLNSAILAGARLELADLTGSDLSWADLRHTDLHLTNIIGANLFQADFSHATMWNTTLADVDLSKAKGLDKVRHLGPSSVGVDTILRSRGGIPYNFLDKVGVPENIYEFIRSLDDLSAKYYSCFISYSTVDQEFANKLYSDLRNSGVRCWFAPEDIKGGRKIHEQLPEAIGLHDTLLLILSESSMLSEWVKTEIYHARQEELREGRRKLFPISIVPFEVIRSWNAFDADVGKDMAREVREYFIPDFSNWSVEDSYNRALHRLLRDLKAGD